MNGNENVGALRDGTLNTLGESNVFVTRSRHHDSDAIILLQFRFAVIRNAQRKIFFHQTVAARTAVVSAMPGIKSDHQLT